MNKTEFLNELKHLLRELPENDLAAALDYYSEAINDMVEDGTSESDAIQRLGTPEEIAAQMIADQKSAPSPKQSKEHARRSPNMIVLIILVILGSPIWLSLAIAAAAIIITAYALLWTAVAVCWSIFASFAASAVAIMISAFSSMFLGRFGYSAVFFGTALIMSGVSILLFIACVKLTITFALLSKKLATHIFSLFKRKESAK